MESPRSNSCRAGSARRIALLGGQCPIVSAIISARFCIAPGCHPCSDPPIAERTPISSDRSPLRRGRKKRQKITRSQITGNTYLSLIEGYLQRLRSVHVHHNRVLFFDDVVTVYLVAFFNPVLRSLRCIEDASQLPGVNQFLSVDCVCKSTLSEANALFDYRHLQGLIEDLRRHLPNLRQSDGKFDYLLKQIEVFDGSFFRVAADVAWAVQSNNQHTKGKSAGGSGYIRLNCKFCLATGNVSGVSISGDDGIGEGSAAEEFVEPGHIYLFDAGVVSFSYLEKILLGGSNFLCCLASGVKFTAHEQRTLSDADVRAGVLSDRIGKLSGSDRRTPPDATVREVIFCFTGRDGVSKTLRLLTDLLTLPANVIAELYRHSWQIELFFRWLKVHASFRHLTSHSRNGITLSFYIAVIAMLLLSLITQRPLSKYGYTMLSMIAAGMGDVLDMLPILENRERQAQRQRELQAAKRAAKKQG